VYLYIILIIDWHNGLYNLLYKGNTMLNEAKSSEASKQVNVPIIQTKDILHTDKGYTSKKNSWIGRHVKLVKGALMGSFAVGVFYFLNRITANDFLQPKLNTGEIQLEVMLSNEFSNILLNDYHCEGKFSIKGSRGFTSADKVRIRAQSINKFLDEIQSMQNNEDFLNNINENYSSEVSGKNSFSIYAFIKKVLDMSNQDSITNVTIECSPELSNNSTLQCVHRIKYNNITGPTLRVDP
jgi:hypothetical protein